MGGGWGCPHEIEDRCAKVDHRPCDPGMKGCVLHGRYRFANEDKNARYYQKRAEAGTATAPADDEATHEGSSGDRR